MKVKRRVIIADKITVDMTARIKEENVEDQDFKTKGGVWRLTLCSSVLFLEMRNLSSVSDSDSCLREIVQLLESLFPA